MASLEINPYLRKPEELNTMQLSWLESLSPFFQYDEISQLLVLVNGWFHFFYICSTENIFFSVNEGKTRNTGFVMLLLWFMGVAVQKTATELWKAVSQVNKHLLIYNELWEIHWIPLSE